MVIVKLQGGLGNQLYEYALYEKLKSQGRQVLLDGIDYTDQAFLRDIREIELGRLAGTDMQFCTLGQHYAYADDKRTLLARARRKLLGRHARVIRESDDGSYMPSVLTSDNVLLDGFWQCQKYYEDIIPRLQSQISFNEGYNDECGRILKQIDQDMTSVSIHIRLGDYVAKSETYGGIATEDYYRSAIQTIKNKIGDVTLYLFSDDVRAAARILDTMNVGYVAVDCNHGENSLYDMMLMSHCRHNICANSSFSIWGATLNLYRDKIAIRPLKSNNSSQESAEEMKSLWQGWTIIDERGIVY